MLPGLLGSFLLPLELPSQSLEDLPDVCHDGLLVSAPSWIVLLYYYVRVMICNACANVSSFFLEVFYAPESDGPSSFSSFLHARSEQDSQAQWHARAPDEGRH